jgi:hypothetical protein
MALVAFMISGTAELAIHALRSTKKADDYLALTNIANMALDRIRALPFDDPALEAGSPPISSASAQTEKTYKTEWTVERVSAGLKKIYFRAFDENGTAGEFRAVFLLSKDMGF